MELDRRNDDDDDDGGGDGVLLYYKFFSVPDLPSLARFYDSNCRSLALLGRVRIGPDGVNATVGGKMKSLAKHIAVMRSNAFFDGTDFKLASCDHPEDERVARECGFTSLNIRVVKELVTFKSNPLSESPEISNAGRHLSAAEFHRVLHDVGASLDSEASLPKNQVVLLDARNVYETRIGKFQTPHAKTLDPEIRQYSDLPLWIDEHSEQLRGKSILMYCTGGIRCEMASSYIRSKGEGFENVFQLFGGIQRYLEQFPDGGYFRGKNFVFDHRISVGSLDQNVLGSCLMCGSFFDDYSSRCRCTHCRMLVLVCSDCQGKFSDEYICELCQKKDRGSWTKPSSKGSTFQLELSPDSSEAIEIEKTMPADHAAPVSELPRSHDCKNPRKLRILCLHGFRQSGSNFKGRTSSLAKKLKNAVEFVFIDAPHELPFIYQPNCGKPPNENPKTRFAWLVAPNSNCSPKKDWKIAAAAFDPLQYRQQTGGFAESYDHIEKTISKMGRFDGILGFSQGAAMAALFCEQQQRLHGAICFEFGIFCSGYSASSSNFDVDLVKLPSLHCFGNGGGQDRQIDNRASVELADRFDDGRKVVVEHEMGHIIPTRPPHIDRMREFLLQFL